MTSPQALSSLSIPPILVATDLSAGARTALMVGRGRSLLTGAPLVIVHVIPDESWGSRRDGSAPDGATTSMAGHRLREQVRACTALADHQYRLHLAHGPPSAAVLSLARKLGAGLVIVGHASDGTATRVTLGRMTEQLGRHTPMSLLAARSAQPQGCIVTNVPLDDGSSAARAVEREAAMRDAALVPCLDEDPVRVAVREQASLIVIDGRHDDPVDVLRRARCSVLVLRVRGARRS
ncbi:MAG: universal stress protein [Myxococcales bacterium]|nr:universal stress protein [Myxococcales bacterium]